MPDSGIRAKRDPPTLQETHNRRMICRQITLIQATAVDLRVFDDRLQRKNTLVPALGYHAEKFIGIKPSGNRGEADFFSQNLLEDFLTPGPLVARGSFV
jgi:hypothetical protein